MRFFDYILYILSFMVVTIIIYIWGLIKSKNDFDKNANRLYSKAISQISHALHENKKMTKNQLLKTISSLEVKTLFSRKKMIITDINDFFNLVIEYMIHKNMIVQTKEAGVIFYSLSKETKKEK